MVGRGAPGPGGRLTTLALSRPRAPRLGAAARSAAVAPVLFAAAWLSLPDGADGVALAETVGRLGALAAALVGAPSELAPAGDPGAFASGARWLALGRLAVATVAMSVLAIAFAAAGALLTVAAGARPAATPRASLVRALRTTAWALTRAVWVGARAVPELVWAVLLVLVMPPGMLVGALALGIHNFGILGKLCSEVVASLDPAPARALRAGGAGPLQLLAYAVLPQALPQFLTYALYRWEVIIRTTIVVGFVGAGGLGREFRLALSFFHWTDLAMILLTYFALVLAVDLVAARLRALARG